MPIVVTAMNDHSGVATDVDSLKFIFDEFLEFRTYQQDKETTYNPDSPLFWENSAKYYVANSTELPEGADYAAKIRSTPGTTSSRRGRICLQVDAPLDDKPVQ